MSILGPDDLVPMWLGFSIASLGTFLFGQLYRYIRKVYLVEKKDMPLDKMLKMRARRKLNEYAEASSYSLSIIFLAIVLYDLIFR